ncbi:cell division protein ZapA [Alcanivorax sp. 1008]|uniref:cell division protein ZapA n=1 Tax=Alcanivorax sp. 1008 TaxID=2816853 RepID=UPI001D4DDBBD|nr:cell division protein ZapA [Alcanivorax sp. 1008]MCC1497418.1 cell division protein ZapA [Alcanivorax sp. 1008]
MSEPSSVLVHLLDKEFRVACPAEEKENLIRAARHLDEKMREVRSSNVLGLERIAVMAALNLAHDLLLAKGELSQQQDGGDRVGRLLDRVEAELAALRDI